MPSCRAEVIARYIGAGRLNNWGKSAMSRHTISSALRPNLIHGGAINFGYIVEEGEDALAGKDLEYAVLHC
jgi:hypothetical protein